MFDIDATVKAQTEEEAFFNGCLVGHRRHGARRPVEGVDRVGEQRAREAVAPDLDVFVAQVLASSMSSPKREPISEQESALSV